MTEFTQLKEDINASKEEIITHNLIFENSFVFFRVK